MSKETKIETIILLASVVISAGIIIAGKVQNQKVDKPPPDSNPPPLDAEQIGETLLRRSAVLKFPEVLSESQISRSELPEALQNFVFNDTPDWEIKSVNYKDGKQGFQINVQLDSPLLVTHDRYRILASDQENGWDLIIGQRANNFAFMESENASYQIRISLFFVDEGSCRVSIQVIAK